MSRRGYSIAIIPLEDGSYRWTVRRNGDTWTGTEESHLQAIVKANQIATKYMVEEEDIPLSFQKAVEGRVS